MLLLEKEPANRFPSAAALVAALDTGDVPASDAPVPPMALANRSSASMSRPSAVGLSAHVNQPTLPDNDEFVRWNAPAVVSSAASSRRTCYVTPSSSSWRSSGAPTCCRSPALEHLHRVQYAKLWADGYDWRDVFKQAKDRLLVDVVSETIDDGAAMFDPQKRDQLRARRRLQGGTSGLRAIFESNRDSVGATAGSPSPIPDRDALALAGAHAPVVQQAMADRNEVMRLVSELPKSQRDALPDVAASATALAEKVRVLAQNLADLERAQAPGGLDTLEREITLLEGQANPLDGGSEERVRRLAQLRRQRRALTGPVPPARAVRAEARDLPAGAAEHEARHAAPEDRAPEPGAHDDDGRPGAGARPQRRRGRLCRRRRRGHRPSRRRLIHAVHGSTPEAHVTPHRDRAPQEVTPVHIDAAPPQGAAASALPAGIPAAARPRVGGAVPDAHVEPPPSRDEIEHDVAVVRRRAFATAAYGAGGVVVASAMALGGGSMWHAVGLPAAMLTLFCGVATAGGTLWTWLGARRLGDAGISVFDALDGAWRETASRAAPSSASRGTGRGARAKASSAAESARRLPDAHRVPATAEVLASRWGTAVTRAVEDRAGVAHLVGELGPADRDMIPDVLPTAELLMRRVGELATTLHEIDRDAPPSLVAEVEARIATARRAAADPPDHDQARRLELLGRRARDVDGPRPAARAALGTARERGPDAPEHAPRPAAAAQCRHRVGARRADERDARGGRPEPGHRPRARRRGGAPPGVTRRRGRHLAPAA